MGALPSSSTHLVLLKVVAHHRKPPRAQQVLVHQLQAERATNKRNHLLLQGDWLVHLSHACPETCQSTDQKVHPPACRRQSWSGGQCPAAQGRALRGRSRLPRGSPARRFRPPPAGLGEREGGSGGQAVGKPARLLPLMNTWPFCGHFTALQATPQCAPPTPGRLQASSPTQLLQAELHEGDFQVALRAAQPAHHNALACGDLWWGRPPATAEGTK